jgi:hypothetical protein
MEQNLDKFITDNLDLFDSDIPEKDHVNRFLDKLDKAEKMVNLRKRYLYVTIAASLLLLISFSGLLLWNYSTLKNKTKCMDSTISNIEFNETGEYYSDQINIGMAKIKSIKYIAPEQKDSVFKELNAMDTNFWQLQDELRHNPYDERVMQAIIGHYQIKLNAVNQIIQLFSISQINSKNIPHENSI